MFLELASVEGEGKDWRGQMGKLNHEAGSVETTARHTRRSEEGPCRVAVCWAGGLDLDACITVGCPLGAATLGLGPFSACASCSLKVAGGTWVSTSSFPTNGRTEFFVTEGDIWAGPRSIHHKGQSESEVSTRGGS